MSATTPKIKFINGEQIPIELHKVRIVQKLHLKPVEERLSAIREDFGDSLWIVKASPGSCDPGVFFPVLSAVLNLHDALLSS